MDQIRHVSISRVVFERREGAHHQPRQAVILAAGAGSRLRESDACLPKPLTAVGGLSLLERAVRNCRDAGVTDIVVVVGYERARIITALADLRLRYGMRIRPAIAEHWALGNGASVLAAEPYVHSPFYLMMCDHIVDPGFFRALRHADDGVRACAVVVDRELDRVPDLAEATKTRITGPYVTAIGKGLVDYDAVDTGVFLCRPPFFDALRDAASAGRHTLSDAVQLLADCRETGWADCGGLQWFDVDTPEDRRRAEEELSGRAVPELLP